MFSFSEIFFSISIIKVIMASYYNSKKSYSNTQDFQNRSNYRSYDFTKCRPDYNDIDDLEEFENDLAWEDQFEKRQRQKFYGRY